jgi:3-hydroxyisobutyrate dehydrogenase-like beta-hydroxyacid dehydrogenase
MRAEAVHMSCSTISVEMSKELERRHRELGQSCISAPVFGRPEAAAEKMLWFIVAGEALQIERCRSVMDALGRGVSVIGGQPWQANLIKIAVNFVLGSMLETVGESYTLVEKHGVDTGKFLEVLNGTIRSPVIENYGKIISERQYEPAGFSLRLGMKDAELAIEAAKAAASPLPLAGILRDHYLQAVAYGHADLDWASIAEISRINANVVRTLKRGE